MRKDKGMKDKGIWLVWVVVALCYVVPYTLLTDVARWYGSFLFWALAGLAVIALNVFITRDFKDR
jgi:lauroyl/myristoyl acyltransferase